MMARKRPRMGSSASTIIPSLASPERIGKKVERKWVPAISLDDYCKETGAYPQFVKIDVEGAEYLVLKGFERTLGTWKPVVVLEYANQPVQHPGQAYGLSANPALRFLAEIGYELFDLDHGCPVDAGDYLKRDIFCHVLASPPESGAKGTASPQTR